MSVLDEGLRVAVKTVDKGAVTYYGVIEDVGVWGVTLAEDWALSRMEKGKPTAEVPHPQVAAVTLPWWRIREVLELRDGVESDEEIAVVGAAGASAEAEE